MGGFTSVWQQRDLASRNDTNATDRNCYNRDKVPSINSSAEGTTMSDFDLLAIVIGPAGRAQNTTDLAAVKLDARDVKYVVFGVAAVSELDMVADGDTFRQNHFVCGARIIKDPAAARDQSARSWRRDGIDSIVLG